MAPTLSCAAVDTQHPNRIAILHGPIVLVWQGTTVPDEGKDISSLSEKAASGA